MSGYRTAPNGACQGASANAIAWWSSITSSGMGGDNIVQIAYLRGLGRVVRRRVLALHPKVESLEVGYLIAVVVENGPTGLTKLGYPTLGLRKSIFLLVM